MSGTDPLIQTLMSRGRESQDRIAGLERDVGASREREDVARQAQQTAMQPTRDKLKATLDAGGPVAPPPMAAPTAPVAPKLDTKEMSDTLALITGLAAIGGALTRQPLTAALNNFSAGVKGLVTGNQMVFQNSLKEFDANLKQAHADNLATWQRYQGARDKYKTDIVGLQNELKLIAAETQNPIDLELARRGDVVSLMKMKEKSANDFDKVLGTVARIQGQQATHQEAVRYHNATLADRAARTAKMGAAKTDPNVQNTLAKEFQIAATKAHADYLKGYDKAKDATERDMLRKRYDDSLDALETNFRSRGFAGTLNGNRGPGTPAPASAAPPAAAPAPGPAPSTGVSNPAIRAFATPDEAERAANLPKGSPGRLEPGMRISIGGTTGVWEQ